MMKSRCRTLIGLFAMLATLATTGAALAQHQQLLDGIAAIVDDDIILVSEVSQGAYLLAMQLGIDPSRQTAEFEKLKKETLDNLITQKVLLTEAEAETVKVDENQVNQLLDQQMQGLLQQLGSEKKIEEYFGQPVSKVRRSYREEIENNLKIRNLQQQKFADLKVNRREVEEFFKAHKDSLPTLKESVNISHILIQVKPSPEADQQAFDLAQKLRKRILAGEDFATLAKQYSQDPGSASRGGELGFLSRGDFVPEFETAAFALDPGQVSDVVKTRFGYHIIQCIDKRGDKINVRHILIPVPVLPKDEEAALRKITDIRKEIVEKGKSFEEMAKKYSDDETTKEQGGLLGWFEMDKFSETAQEFRAVAETLKVGEVSAPFKTKYGYHLLRMNARQEARPLSLEKDWDKIEAMALEMKRREKFKEWVDQLKKRIYIEVKEM